LCLWALSFVVEGILNEMPNVCMGQVRLEVCIRGLTLAVKYKYTTPCKPKQKRAKCKAKSSKNFDSV
jgi:hypothetical protein